VPLLEAIAEVERVWSETPRLIGVSLDVPPELARAHLHPGQVVRAHDAHGEHLHLALASVPPSTDEPRPRFELLVGQQAASRLELVAGARLRLEGPAGPGFPLARARGQDLLLFAVGSGLAPLRPVIELVRRARSDFGQVTLYVGAHTREELPYARHFDAWDRDRIDVITSVSRPWVQERFADDPPPVGSAYAFVAGMQAMIDGVTDALAAAGMPRERVLRNW
jgi:sulfhydrogenase subunit gamma (sulfur reductase)